MERDSLLFGGAVVGVILGLAIMLYGVSLTAGQTWNTEMLVGGLVTLGAIIVMTIRIGRMESAEM
jgi:membrane-associated PAP2 superfamily phosphatase